MPPFKDKIKRRDINRWLWDNNGDRPYFYWIFDNCTGKDDPAAWAAEGMINYYAAYLN